ncbi:OsmC family protein [Pimelobacter simplex]|uniref:OsmC family protein n=1 Tax=Nocardioides simplex TaxID=2045 RepID=UPI003672F704
MADLSPFGVRAAAGTLRRGEGVVLPHAWTDDGVLAAPAANGAQVLHLSVALCVLNDTYREAERLGLPLAGVAVTADGGFDEAWRSTGIHYAVEVDSAGDPDRLTRLHAIVDEVAEIPRALRAGADVRRSAT